MEALLLEYGIPALIAVPDEASLTDVIFNLSAAVFWLFLTVNRRPPAAPARTRIA